MTELNKYFVPRVNRMLEDLRERALSGLPDSGNEFTRLYSDFPVKYPTLCITDVLLSIDPIPKFIADKDDKRYLTLHVYKLPCTIKSTRILFVGTSVELRHRLNDPALISIIIKAIQDLDSNLDDV